MATMIKDLVYAFKQSLSQIWRNKVMSLASLFSITAMLLILSVFFILTVNVNMATENIKDQFNTIEVFLLDTTTRKDANTIQKSIETMDEVASVKYISKDEALDSFKLRYGEKSYIFDGLAENPLPNSLRVELNNLERGEVVAEVCRNMEGVEDIRYYQTEVNKILKVTNALQKIALVFVFFLVIVSIVVVANTIKITLEARKTEIAIMKYVGATNGFVRGPMIFEGVILGLISSLISFGITSSVYAKLIVKYSDQMMALLSTSFVDAAYMAKSLLWIFLALGISIGAVGSIISMRRYLKEQ